MSDLLKDLKNIGTPKNLDEAIMQAMSFGKLSDFPDRMYEIFVDYLRQRFATAVLLAKSPEQEIMLLELLQKIIKREDI